MIVNQKPDRSGPQVTYTNPAALDDAAVLRLSRASLRAQPPVVQFVERSSTISGQQRMLWPA
jgi:hypothetical protein